MGFLTNRIKQLDNGREVLEMPNSVNFIVLTKDKQLVLAEQKRAGNNELSTLNCFGGYIEKEDEDKNLEFTVQKELFEESNITKKEISEIRAIYANKKLSVGYTTEASSLFIIILNKNLSELNLKCNDKKEDIKIKTMKASESNILRLKLETNCLKFHLALDYLLRFKFSLLK